MTPTTSTPMTASTTANWRCGDGVVRTDLAEDDAGLKRDDGDEDETNGCKNDCTPRVCGDGVVGLGEGCDDGNDDPDDDCDGCRPKICGDGILGLKSSAMTATRSTRTSAPTNAPRLPAVMGFCVRTSTTRGTLSRSVMTATP